MNLPPPKICRRICQLHALVGSSNAHEAESARKKLTGLLDMYGLSWNDLRAIFATADAGDGVASTAQPQPDDMPAMCSIWSCI
jgi:hypothetical protein